MSDVVVAGAARRVSLVKRIARSLLILSVPLSAACKVSLPSGVFPCGDGEACPPGQACSADDFCREGTAGPDAGSDTDGGRSDSGVDAATDAGNAGRAGVGGGEAGRGGQGATPAAGSGGSGGTAGQAGQGSEQNLRVLSTAPEADGVLEDLGAALKITFSARLQADSVTTESVKLTRDGSDVAGSVQVSGASLTFKPDLPWTLAMHYELKLTAAVHDTDDHALSAFTLGFTTRDGRWMREKRVDGAGGVIASASDGFAVLAWSQTSSSPSDSYPEMWAAQFTPPSAWSTPVMIKSGVNGSFLQNVVVNRRHHAAVSWTSISNNVNTTAYTTGPAWGPDAYIAQTAYHDHMLLTEQDELMVVADSQASGEYGIKGARFTLGAVSPTSIDVGGAGGGNQQPGIALLDDDPRVIWQHTVSGTSTSIQSGALSSSTGTALSTEGVVAANPVLAGDSNHASIIAAWEQADPSWTNVWVSRMASGADWSAPVRISDDRSSAAYIQLALDPSGRALVIWRQAGAIASAHFTPGTGWSAAEIISAAGAMNIDPPRLVLDAAGNGIAAWTQDGAVSGLNEVWIARYLRAAGWQAANRVRVSDVEAGTADTISVSTDDYGRAFVIWSQENAVWSSRFD